VLDLRFHQFHQLPCWEIHELNRGF
jgi:hypothetical protein